MQAGERQVAPDRKGIRRDHLSRYEWALTRLAPESSIIDLACGVGYGTQLLAAGGHEVIGVDRDKEAILYAREHYAHDKAVYWRADADHLRIHEQYDAAICFETIEHVRDPRVLLKELARCAPRLLASVPNEEMFPWQNHAFHYRHYTPAEFTALLRECGWRVVEKWGQADTNSEVERDVVGRTLVYVCERAAAESIDNQLGAVAADIEAEIARPPKRYWLINKSALSQLKKLAPDHVVILGMGPSLEQYVDLVKRLGGRKKFSDEVWAINALGDVIQCDRVFHMDDVLVQEARAADKPQSNIATMVDWLKSHPGPIYTSVKDADGRDRSAYPGLIEFPLEAVINVLGHAYFNSTAAYAVAFAIFLGVKKISLFGCDFTYSNSHQAEKGRACVEFWLGMASERGIELGMADRSSLMDFCEPDDRKFYGYDAVRIHLAEQREGPMRVLFTPRDLPTAEQIEKRYDHSRHPNELVQ